MKKLFTYLSPYYPRMSLGLAIKTVGTVVELFLPWILAHIVDDVIPTGKRPPIFFWGGMMIRLSLVAVIFNIIANRMASAVARDTTRRIRHDLFSKVSYLDAAQVDKLSISSLESRLTGDTYNVNHMIGMMLRLGIRAPILLFGGIIMTLTLDWRLTLVLILTLPFLFFVVTVTSRVGIPLYKKLQAKNDEVTRVVREDASGVRVIKALSKTEYEKKRFDDANSDAIAMEKKAGVTMAKINPIMTFVLNAGMCAVIGAGAFLVTKGKSEAGTIIAFMSYFTIIANALISISRIFVNLSKGTASMARIAEVLSEDYELRVENTDNTESHDESAPYIEFRHVTFGYGESVILKDVSFTLMRHETLGIIGETGSGKSTILNLLMRFYDADEGEIFLDGQNIKDIPTQRLRSMFGVVFQNDFLFADTIRENIRFGREIADDAIESGAKDAQAHTFITSRADGYDDSLAIKGANLSGGQKQRLLIARALAADPDILVLDDSSSALDYKTDSLLRSAIASHFSHTTTVIVAQRVSSLAHADKILVLSEGRVAACGKHEELLVTSPLYEEISNSQMGGALLD